MVFYRIKRFKGQRIKKFRDYDRKTKYIAKEFGALYEEELYDKYVDEQRYTEDDEEYNRLDAKLNKIDKLREWYECIFLMYLAKGWMKIREIKKERVSSEIIKVHYQIYSKTNKVYKMEFTPEKGERKITITRIGDNESSFILTMIGSASLSKHRNWNFAFMSKRL